MEQNKKITNLLWTRNFFIILLLQNFEKTFIIININSAIYLSENSQAQKVALVIKGLFFNTWKTFLNHFEYFSFLKFSQSVKTSHGIKSTQQFKDYNLFNDLPHC